VQKDDKLTHLTFEVTDKVHPSILGRVRKELQGHVWQKPYTGQVKLSWEGADVSAVNPPPEEADSEFISHLVRVLRQPPVDAVNHPPHYNQSRFEVIEVLMDWFPHEPLLWNTVKYLARAKYKENYLQDLQKALWYLSRAVQEAQARETQEVERGPASN